MFLFNSASDQTLFSVKKKWSNFIFSSTIYVDTFFFLCLWLWLRVWFRLDCTSYYYIFSNNNVLEMKSQYYDIFFTSRQPIARFLSLTQHKYETINICWIFPPSQNTTRNHIFFIFYNIQCAYMHIINQNIPLNLFSKSFTLKISNFISWMCFIYWYDPNKEVILTLSYVFPLMVDAPLYLGWRTHFIN